MLPSVVVVHHIAATWYSEEPGPGTKAAQATDGLVVERQTLGS